MRLRCLLLLLALPLHLSAADHTRLLLAGGALPVCSNAQPEACVAGTVLAPAPAAARYRLDAAGIGRTAASGWLSARADARTRVLGALRRWLARAGAHDFAADALPQALGAEGGAWSDLAGFEQARILDALERTPLTEELRLDASTETSGASIYRELVAMARASGHQRPRVLISTASSRDPYAAIDYYRDLYTQAGAEVRWLPLDQAVRAARDADDCARLDRLRGQLGGAHDRDRLYPARAAELAHACAEPERRLELLRWADALFLNGGDQSYTRAAWFLADGRASADLELLRQRLRAGTLVLAGTSAGTAVQSGPVMMVSGPALPRGKPWPLRQLPPDPDCRAAKACAGVDPDALMFHPDGGLGSFADGVLDTHFSQRGRDYRLATLLIHGAAGLGVGIDEGTALRLERDAGGWRGRVIGAAGVTVLQSRDRQTLARWRYRSGDDLRLPPPAHAGAGCAGLPLPPIQAGVDGLALAALFDRLQLSRPQPLVLVQGSERVQAGWICAGERGARLWTLPPAR
ncbi:MAG: cyanophycinase [Lysobacterales bacterium]